MPNQGRGFSFPSQKYDDPTALYKNFRYLQDYLSAINETALGGAAYDLVVAAVDSVDYDRADVVCTGSNDDQTINDAIAAYKGTNGVSVFLMGGNYRFDGEVNPGSGKVLVAGAGLSTRINYYGADYAFYCANDGSDYTFRDFHLQNYATGIYGIYVPGTAYTQMTFVDNVHFVGWTAGFRHDRTAGNHWLYNCYFESCTYGVEGDREGRLKVSNSVFSSCTTAGIYADSQWQQFENNSFLGGQYGIHERGGLGHGGSTGANIIGNHFNQQSVASIRLDTNGTSPDSIVGNVFTSGPMGVLMDNWFGAISPCAIVGNVFSAMTVAYDTSIKNAASVYKGNVFDDGTPVIIEVDTIAALGDVTDVTISSVADGEVLRWDGSAWINNTLAELGASATGHTHVEADVTDLQSYLLNITAEPLSDLSDVTITTIAAGELLKWDGAGWVNNTLAEANIDPAGTDNSTNVTLTGTGTYLSIVGQAITVDPITESDISDLTHYTDPLTTKGDLMVFDTDANRLPLGTNTQVLTVDTTTASGVKWATAGSGVAALDDVGDVTITTIADGETLRWNGSAWINNTLAELGVDPAGTDNSTDVTLAGTGTYLSLAGQAITVDPITESDISDLAHTTANVPTALSTGTVTATTYGITSDGGADDVVLAEATTSTAGLLGSAKWNEIVANTAKVGVTTQISNITGEPLSDLSDVTITTIADGETLRWNGTAWINNTLVELGVAFASHSHLLDGSLSDVVITTPADNEVLAYNTGTSDWINQTAAEAGLATTTDLGSYLPLAGGTVTGNINMGGGGGILYSDISGSQEIIGLIGGTGVSGTDAGIAIRGASDFYLPNQIDINTHGADLDITADTVWRNSSNVQSGSISGYAGATREMLIIEGGNGASTDSRLQIYGSSDSAAPGRIQATLTGSGKFIIVGGDLDMNGNNIVNVGAMDIDWTDYSPTLTNITVGNGTQVCRYTRVGNTVTLVYYLLLGTTSTIGTTPTISLPFNTNASLASGFPLGTALLRDASAGYYAATAYKASTAGFGLWVHVASGTYTVMNSISATAPWTWTTSDRFQATLVFEATS